MKRILSVFIAAALVLALMACEIPTDPDDTTSGDTTPPTAVSSLNGTAGNGAVTLTWTDPAESDLAHIEITWTAGNGGSITAAKSAAPNRANTTTITALAHGTSYTFIVMAVDASGNKSEPRAVPVTLDVLFPAVTSLAARPSDGAVTLTWTDPAKTNLARIEITWSPGGDTLVEPVEIARGTQTYTAQSLTNDTGYTFTVIAVYASGDRSDPRTVSATPDGTPPAAVTGLTGTGSMGQVTLTWTDPEDSDLDHIEIIWTAGDGGSVTAPKSAAANRANATTITALANGTVYTFTVTTVDTAGNESSPQSAQVTPMDPPPGIVTSLDGDPYNGYVRLSWTDPADADLDHIEITWSGESITVAKSATARYNNTFIRDLTNGTPYTFTVKAVDAGGNKSNPQTVTVTPFDDTPILRSITELENYLEDGGSTTTDRPLPVRLALNLTNTWTDLLTALETAGKWVSLNLSDCAMSGTEFDPGTAVPEGTDRIVSLTLPDAAKTIKAGSGSSTVTFMNFDQLRSISGSNIETIGQYAFREREHLETVNFPKAVTIGQQAFYECKALKTLNIPKAVTIEDYAFYYCENVVSVDLPEAITIGPYAFQYCHLLATLNLPEAKTIGDSAFEYCSYLTTANLPKVTTIESYAFHQCHRLPIDFQSVTSIGYAAFSECDLVETANLPEAITIDGNAFYECQNLTTVTLPKATSIEFAAFGNCDKLKTVYLPEVVTISSYAFMGCFALEEVAFPKALTIGAGAFLNAGLKKAILPAVTTVTGDTGDTAYGAFEGCTSLKEVDLRAVTDIGYEAFRGCTALEEITLPAVKTIGAEAFYRCTTLAKVAFRIATTIGASAFFGCTTLEEVTLPAVETISDSAFSGCIALKEVTLQAAKTIGASAFSGCTTLEEVTLQAATTIGASAFSGCIALERLVLPVVTRIGDYAFLNTGDTGLTIIMPQIAPTVSAETTASTTYSKDVIIMTPAEHTGYVENWETDFKKAFGEDAVIDLALQVQ
jgi:hypothetical protein